MAGVDRIMLHVKSLILVVDRFGELWLQGVERSDDRSISHVRKHVRVQIDRRCPM